MALDQELGLYAQIKPDLLSRAPGQWVLIKGAELIGLYPDFDSALRDAVAKGLQAPYLIKQILEQEPVEII